MKRLLLASNGLAAIEGMKTLFNNLKEMKLAYITTASKGVDDVQYLIWRKEEMERVGIDYEEIDIEGKDTDELRNILGDRNTVYVEGGNAFYLLKAVRESGFDVIIKELLEKGVIYIGSSAGAYIACPTIEMATWELKQKDRFGVTDLTALNLVPFLVTAHYVPEMKDVLRSKISKTEYPTKILRDGQAILVNGNEVKCIGEGQTIESL